MVSHGFLGDAGFGPSTVWLLKPPKRKEGIVEFLHKVAIGTETEGGGLDSLYPCKEERDEFAIRLGQQYLFILLGVPNQKAGTKLEL